MFCLVSLISLFKVPCTPVSSTSRHLCFSLSTISSYTSRQVTVTDLQRVKKAAVPQWSTTPLPFLHPFITQLHLSPLQILPPAESFWRVQDGASTGEPKLGGRLTGYSCYKNQRYGGNKGKILVGGTPARNDTGKCQWHLQSFRSTP